LQYLPFDALPVPAAAARPDAPDDELPLLVSRHEIVALPSVSTLAAIRRERPRSAPAGQLIAVLADPVFSSDDQRVQSRPAPAAGAPAAADVEFEQLAVRAVAARSGASGLARLLHSSEEADAIVAAAPAGTAWAAKAFAASRETAMSTQVGQFRIVHFATHGLIDSEHPELSGIVLSMVDPAGGRVNGFLQLHDIYNLSLSADLVVLSACDTALGKDVKGEGLIGLTRGFMYAGARSVVSSLWKVDDRATAELMGLFYKAMLQDGLPPAAALRSAKEALRRQRRWHAPYFWAGFVLQGEYREPIKVGRSARLPAGAALLLPPLLITAGLLVFKRWCRAHALR
jgi:CHAT domain-containing protein